MEKVKLPRNVAEAITHLKKHHGGNETILFGVLGNANGSCIVTIREFCGSTDENFNTILSALVNGYEVEETPDDKVREYYKSVANAIGGDTYTTGYNIGARNAVTSVLDILNIKIEGVNI